MLEEKLSGLQGKQGSEFGLLSGEVSGQKLHKKNQELCLD